MTFNAVKKLAIECLKDGRVQAVERDDVAEKNLLKTGMLSADDVIALLNYSKASDYRCEPHDDMPEIEVHFFQPKTMGKDWYIKLYFIDPDCWFISVHESQIKKTTKKTLGKK